MSKKLSEGCFLYQTGMEGIADLKSLLSSSAQTLFKDIYVNGVGIKKIDKIEGDIITFNQGYKAIDDYVIYEIYNDESSVLTTVKKIDENNFKCNEDISAIKGAASMRIPPLGLEYAGKTASGGSDVYLNKYGNAFLISNSGYIFVQKTKDSLYVGGYTNMYSDAILVSEYEVISPPRVYVGITEDGAPTAAAYGQYGEGISYFKTAYDEIIDDDAQNHYLFPATAYSNGGASVAIARSISDVETKSSLFSSVYVGKSRSELRNLRASSSSFSSKQQGVFDFYINENERHLFIHHKEDVIALIVPDDSSQSGAAVRIARLES